MDSPEKHYEPMERKLLEMKLLVPTYNGNLYGDAVTRNEKPEFGEPNVPMLIREADGARIVLGTHEYADYDAPDVQIERQPKGWAFFLRPLGGSDPCGYMYFRDDGQSYFRPEFSRFTPPVVIITNRDPIPGFEVPT
jgi:hypothetical protein